MELKKGKILIIDDSKSILFLLESILSQYFDVVALERATEALEMVDTSFDTIIIDLMMPEMSGIEFIQKFREKIEFDHIPVIVLTAKHNTEEDIANLFEIGANDYISKPFFSAELVARVKTHAKVKLLAENLMEVNKKLNYTATHDELTEVFNRTAIFDFLENEILRIKRSQNCLVLMMFDIDHFKEINDTYGHQAGDFILKKVIEVTRSVVREADLIGRFGGDEFLIILSNTDTEIAVHVANRMLTKLREEKFNFNEDTKLSISISLGLPEYQPGESIDSFIERVDNALYDAKKAGRDCAKVR